MSVAPHVFPPTLAPVLRDRVASKVGPLAEIGDDVLIDLLTTVFFAGLETYESERNPIRVVFLGKSPLELVMPEGAEPGAVPVYRWKVLRFDTPRPFVIPELVKLAVASANDRLYSAVRLVGDQKVAITGLAREGLNAEGDPFIKIIASRPGCLSIRSGRDRLVEYERGAILTGGEDVVMSANQVRRALDRAARAAGMDADGVPAYVDAIRALVGEMAAHGRGGILVISPEENPPGAEGAAYKMVLDSSLATLLRLSHRIDRGNGEATPPRPESVSFGYLLRNAFVTEAERVTEELGALTGIDGATVLNCNLALVAFGVILPVKGAIAVAEATGREGMRPRPVDLGHRGTRHRAAATYAADHPGSIVFVASEDGHVTCMLRDPSEAQVLLWRLGPSVAP